MGSRAGLNLREQALEALEKSTKMFEVAFELLKQGNRAEAERLRNEARTQRTISTLLMAEANRQETKSTPSAGGYPVLPAFRRPVRSGETKAPDARRGSD